MKIGEASTDPAFNLSSLVRIEKPKGEHMEQRSVGEKKKWWWRRREGEGRSCGVSRSVGPLGSPSYRSQNRLA